MTKKLRLLWSSNAPWASSGYAVQSKSALTRFAELPEFGGRENLGILAWYGLAGGIHYVDGFRCYPGGNDPYANDVIGPYTRHFGANVVIPLIDAWVNHDTAKKIHPALYCPWFPVDHDPLPQRVIDGIAGAHMPLTYSKWGRDMCIKAGISNTYIPHGIETSIYNVQQPRNQVLNFKRQLTGIENSHLSIMVAANKGFPDRKWFQGQLRAWAEFAKDKPHAYLYIHTEPTQLYGGVDFQWLLGHLGIADKVRFPERIENFLGLPPQYLKMVYNAADVLMSCSMSEGFGIPIIEAEACGTPVLVTDFSAMPELVRWGRIVKVADYVLTPMNAFQAWPDVRHMVDCLQELYAEWEEAGGDWPIEKRVETSAQIHTEYSWDTIVRDQWAPLMTRLADEAPPLDARFQAQGVSVGDFVGELKNELAKDTTSASKPKRRVAPLLAKREVVAE